MAFENSELLKPPAHELHFLVDGTAIGGRTKGIYRPTHYENNGDVRGQRVSKGNPPILRMHGIPYIRVKGRYYALIGSKAAATPKVSWLLTKNGGTLKAHKDYYARFVFAMRMSSQRYRAVRDIMRISMTKHAPLLKTRKSQRTAIDYQRNGMVCKIRNSRPILCNFMTPTTMFDTSLTLPMIPLI